MSDFEERVIKKFNHQLQAFPWTNLQFFNPEEYFGEFHYFEELTEESEKKEYERGDFQRDYGEGMQTYYWKLYKVSDFQNKFPSRLFIVVHSTIGKKEERELEPYCPCKYHQPPKWFVIVKLICFML